MIPERGGNQAQDTEKKGFTDTNKLVGWRFVESNFAQFHASIRVDFQVGGKARVLVLGTQGGASTDGGRRAAGKQMGMNIGRVARMVEARPNPSALRH
jgi:hypothetical protein